MIEQKIITASIPSSLSRDECIYCYESPINDSHHHEIGNQTHQLHICIDCWQPLCSRHVPLHLDATSDEPHFYYLTIAKVKKLKEKTPDEEEDLANKKLKLQVVDKAEDDIYDTLWELSEWDSNKAVDHRTIAKSYDEGYKLISPEIQSKVTAILAVKSQALVDQTAAWQLEVKPCSHVIELRTMNFPADKKLDISKCNFCGLAQNLWLCLYCGNVGCGREQVGIEGNSHALKHYEECKSHPVAVKLGSLSGSSSDIYCYQCDDDVMFESTSALEKVLHHYGIDLTHQSASEKTLVELQVEQNMNWSFNMLDSEGKELQKLNASKEYGVGLINLGNSCYLNSVVQCFYNGGIPTWSLKQLNLEFPKSVVFPSKNLECQMVKLTRALKMEPNLYQDGIKPTSFKNCIGQGHEEFSTNRQQDAMEFLGYMVDALDKKLFKNTENPNDALRFIMEDRLQCNNCKGVKYSTEPAESIQLPLLENDDPQDLLERINSYFEGTTIEFTCPRCKVSVNASKKPAFRTLPDTLIVNPIRIKLQNWVPVKTSNELSIPGLVDESETLVVSKYISSGFDVSKEELLEDDNDSAFKPNETIVGQLMEMSFSRNAAIRALFNTGNTDPEAAVNWLFSHIEDPEVNDEFIPPKSEASNKPTVDPEAMGNMVSMGLDPKLCRKALILNKGDINRSVEWVFSNLDDDGEISEENNSTGANTEKAYGNTSILPYKLTAVVCHKGNSVHSGHYVAFVRKVVQGRVTWVLYNDEKIVVADSKESLEEIKKNGYILFYSRTADW